MACLLQLLRALLVVAVLVSSALATAPAASAGFSTRSNAAQPFTSATLQAPSEFSVTTGCSLVVIGPSADLRWTATPSAFAAGYKIERWSGSTLQATATVTPRTTTSLTETGLSTGTTYTWRIYAYYQSWTSTVSSASGTTPSLCL